MSFNNLRYFKLGMMDRTKDPLSGEVGVRGGVVGVHEVGELGLGECKIGMGVNCTGG